MLCFSCLKELDRLKLLKIKDKTIDKIYENEMIINQINYEV